MEPQRQRLRLDSFDRQPRQRSESLDLMTLSPSKKDGDYLTSRYEGYQPTTQKKRNGAAAFSIFGKDSDRFVFSSPTMKSRGDRSPFHLSPEKSSAKLQLTLDGGSQLLDGFSKHNDESIGKTMNVLDMEAGNSMHFFPVATKLGVMMPNSNGSKRQGGSSNGYF